jgi:hypothetical protein
MQLLPSLPQQQAITKDSLNPIYTAPVGTKLNPDDEPEFNPAKMRLREIHKAISICEQIFWETGTMPTVERFLELSSYRTRKQVEELFTSHDFIQKCHERGLPRSASVKSVREAMTVEQLVAINVMLNPMDHRSDRAKLDTANDVLESEGYERISMFKWNTWRRTPAFQEFLKVRATELFKSADYKWYQALEQQVANGDVAAMKLFAQARGINLEPERIQVQIDISNAVAAIFEILAEFVAPAVLAQIGEKLDEYLRQSTSGAIEISEAGT